MSITPETSPPAAEPDPAPTGRRRRAARRGLGRTIFDYALTLGIALLIAVLIKTFVVQPFYVPSGSMRPTLMEQDKMLVSKFHDDLKDINRGDVVVFEDPSDWVGSEFPEPTGARAGVQKALSVVGLMPDPSQRFLVKRVIGMPGDTVQCESTDGPVKVNGEELTEPYISPDAGACQAEFSVTVPQGKFWVMGDNRYRSADSAYREASGIDGFVPEDHLVGRAFVIMWPISSWAWLNDGEKSFSGVPEPSARADQVTLRRGDLAAAA